MNRFINVSIDSMILTVIDDINGTEINLDKLPYSLSDFINDITENVVYWLMEYDSELTLSLVKDCIIQTAEQYDILM